MAEPPHRVVLVADELVRGLAARAATDLSNSGCRVAGCANTDAGFERSGLGGVGRLELDCSLPEPDGVDLARVLGRNGHNIHIVILIGGGCEDTVVRGLRLGPRGCPVRSLGALGTRGHRLERLMGAWEARRRTEQAEAAQRESELRYRTLFEASHDAVYISTPEGRLLDINQAGVELLGYPSREELLTADLSNGLYIDPWERDRVKRLLAERGCVKDQELRLRRWDGQEIVVQETATAVRDGTGRALAYHGILRDVTGQRALEEQLRQAQKMEAVGTLAGGIAHEFNNLLTAIMGNVELARLSLGEGQSALRALANIEAAATQASAVARSLLTFSHRTPTRRAPVELARVVADSTRLLRRVLPASIELVEDVPADLSAWVRADDNQLQQVLMNLAINARDAMPDGGRLRIALRVESLRESGFVPGDSRPDLPGVTMVVEDTGAGMSDEVRTRVFEPFFTTKRRGEGTGLGMSVIYGIVTEHEGHVRVESEVGSGTRVTTWLPACEPSAPAEVSTPAAGRPVAGHGELVVLTENDRQVRAILASALKSAGYGVIQAADGAAAVAAVKARQDEVSMAILDLDLPKKPGLACLREIRSLQVDAPVIVLTGDFDFEPEGVLGEGEHLLRKPFRTTELLELAGRLIVTCQGARAG